MSEVIALTIEELSALFIGIFRSIKNDLIFPIIFPRDALSIEEQVVSTVRGQKTTILSQEDQLCSQTRVITAQSREIAILNDLLAQRDKGIERLTQRIKSLELIQF